jgi:RepB DNA-primase from phage plasmid
MSATSVTNEVFLRAMFEDAASGTYTMVASFPGDPYKAGRGAWAGRPWAPGERLPRNFSAGNTYLTVSMFEPDPMSGEQRRRKSQFHALHAVMIDDVGTKVHRDKLLLPPSALIETSPANYQAFLFVRQDTSSQARPTCERLIAAMIESGLTATGKDPGMAGVTRYGRLPRGINAKSKYVEQLGRPFPVRCVDFNPQQRYTVAEIAAAWRLDLTAKPNAFHSRLGVAPVSAEQVTRAEQQFSALIELLEQLGMYKGRIGRGPWHDITCPWIESHTDRADSGTAISDPSAENNYAGGFRCHHGHGKDWHMSDVRRWVRGLCAAAATANAQVSL